MSILDGNNQTGDKRTLIAIVLSVVVISGGFLLQAALFPAPRAKPIQATQTEQPAQTSLPTATPNGAQPSPAATQIVADQAKAGNGAVGGATVIGVGTQDAASPISERTYTISTDLLQAVLTNKGGDLVSLKLKMHKDKGGDVDLIVPGKDGTGGLTLAFGDTGTAPATGIMSAMQLDSTTIVFSGKYLATVPGKSAPVPFVMKKTYTFKNGEYMFGLAVSFENSVNEILPIGDSGTAYSLSVGPQIGPRLTSVPGSYTDYRRFVRLIGGKAKEDSPKAGVPMVVKDQPTWVGLSGKYFTFLAVPDLSSFKTTYSMAPDPYLFQSDVVTISRPAINASSQMDKYYFYFGPKTNAELKKYNYADKNAFKQSGLNLELAANSSDILLWLETIMKFFLGLFYKLIPNYGIAIILVTILVKAVLFPLTRNGSVSAAKMQELKPKIDELQAKYKGNPQKLNQEMAEFYKKEGYNPMSGCLPLLIQFPIFIAMYNLFNNHFDLRGALFIPGWIPDLSVPEAIVSFPTVNLLIWQVGALRVLPIIYLVSQLLYGKYTQMTSPGQSATQMKVMMYGMPIMFFFILYNTPSGLLVYWIVSNLLSIGQQIVINDMLKKRREALAAAAPAPVLAPNRKHSKNKKR